MPRYYIQKKDESKERVKDENERLQTTDVHLETSISQLTNPMNATIFL